MDSSLKSHSVGDTDELLESQGLHQPKRSSYAFSMRKGSSSWITVESDFSQIYRSEEDFSIFICTFVCASMPQPYLPFRCFVISSQAVIVPCCMPLRMHAASSQRNAWDLRLQRRKTCTSLLYQKENQNSIGVFYILIIPWQDTYAVKMTKSHLCHNHLPGTYLLENNLPPPLLSSLPPHVLLSLLQVSGITLTEGQRHKAGRGEQRRTRKGLAALNGCLFPYITSI